MVRPVEDAEPFVKHPDNGDRSCWPAPRCSEHAAGESLPWEAFAMTDSAKADRREAALPPRGQPSLPNLEGLAWHLGMAPASAGLSVGRAFTRLLDVGTWNSRTCTEHRFPGRRAHSARRYALTFTGASPHRGDWATYDPDRSVSAHRDCLSPSPHASTTLYLNPRSRRVGLPCICTAMGQRCLEHQQCRHHRGLDHVGERSYGTCSLDLFGAER